jgi:hypothetical protein
MDWLLDLRVLRVFSFYLAVIFIISTYLRLTQYRAVLSLVARLKSRWPNLTSLVVSHRHILLTRGTFLPMILVFALLLGNMLASQFIWPQADLFTLRNLLSVWPAVPFVGLSALAMVTFDTVGTVRVGQIDEKEIEQYFDQAEFWLKGWKAPVVRIVSLGFINPRQIVAKEVRTALAGASALLNSTLWWVSIQTTLRILFGLSLWLSYGLQGWLVGLVG